MEAAIITTYRCINRCVMCNIWKNQTKPENEFKSEILLKLPSLKFANITGGEPLLRDDFEEIVKILLMKSKRVVVSTNGYFTEKIVKIAEKFKKSNFGVRISIEGLPSANDDLRGLQNCFDHGLRTLLELQRIGLKDIGFGITVSDRNAHDMIELYQLAKGLRVEFATAVVHNSYYFHKHDNKIMKKEFVINCFEILINELLRSKKIKNWFRAYFNFGLINYIQGNPRLLPCGAGTDMFFLDPFGNVRPCNGLDTDSEEMSFGNLNQLTFEQIWFGDKAEEIRKRVKDCSKNCWMIGTASPAMKQNLLKVSFWVIGNKIKLLLGKEFYVK